MFNNQSILHYSAALATIGIMIRINFREYFIANTATIKSSFIDIIGVRNLFKTTMAEQKFVVVD